MSGDLSLSLSLDTHSVESFGWTLRVSANEGYDSIVTKRVPPEIAERIADIISPEVAQRVQAANTDAARRVVELVEIAQKAAERSEKAAVMAAAWRCGA